MKFPVDCYLAVQQLINEGWIKLKINEFYIFFGQERKRCKLVIETKNIINLPDERKHIRPRAQAKKYRKS